MRRFIRWLFSGSRHAGLVGALMLAGLIGSGLLLWSVSERFSPRSGDLLKWWRGDAQTKEDLITLQRDACPNAPFILPADGFIGLLYEKFPDPRFKGINDVVISNLVRHMCVV